MPLIWMGLKARNICAIRLLVIDQDCVLRMGFFDECHSKSIEKEWGGFIGYRFLE